MKGIPIFTRKSSSKVCVVCGFGTKDGVAVFSDPGVSRWACAKHLRFVSDGVDDDMQRIVDGLADGSLR